MFFFSRKRYFNTSHVTVYHINAGVGVVSSANFNTSHVTVYQLHQYFCQFRHTYFNTSHVTVYLISLHFEKLSQVYFNTSHVTVYLRILLYEIQFIHISIHPMLRFINLENPLVANALKFQYIPCYGLSSQTSCSAPRLQNFNTSHVTVYHIIFSIGLLLIKFQYIPCYGLSNDFKPFLSWHLSSFPLFYVISAFFTSRL